MQGVAVLIFVVLFVTVLLVISLGTRLIEAERKKKVAGILSAAEDAPQVQTALLQEASAELAGLRLSALAELPLLKRLQTTIDQAGLEWKATGVVIAMAVAAAAGMYAGSRIRVPLVQQASMAGFALLFGALPYAYVKFKRRKRLRDFEEQFPEALDFLARAMRAGHAFSISMEMLSQDSPDPLGIEFRRLYHEQNLGAPLDTALRSFGDRVPLVDVRFFVSAVLFQQQTGGNLAEILTQLGYIIRERFRLKGQVRAASAHGRLTAGILTVLPIVTMFGLMFTNPGYVESMANTATGQKLIIGIVAGQLLGYFTIRKIINIKV